MDSREVGDLLDECLGAAKAAGRQSTGVSEADRLNYCSCRDLLCAELASLLQEAMDMKWPFAPEKWQYKQSVSTTDKTNLNDLISKHLSQLLDLLKASIRAEEAHCALAVVFLVDRYLYWTDDSSRLLKIAKLLHRRYPETPIAPQLVIRQARVYFNSGKLQKAEYILSSLINNSGTTGRWIYHSESDRVLVQAVSVQVRGTILQKLGLWLEAAELIWASLVGYYSLPQPDKKTTQGTCLLSYSFSVECPDSQRQSFLQQAQEAFTIGLLTRAEGDLVTSKQELHTVLKAAYSLTVTHKWLGTPLEVVAQAVQACQNALSSFYSYCHAGTQDKDSLCTEIMHLVTQVKLLLRVEPFLNSDKGSFIPDSYRNVKDTSVNFTLAGFAKIMRRFQKYHKSLCETTNTHCRDAKDELEMDRGRPCITALWTTTGTLNTEAQGGSHSSSVHMPQKPESTDILDSSWQEVSLKSSGSPRPSSSYTGSSAIGHREGATNQSCLPTEVDEERSDDKSRSPDENKKRNLQGCNSGVNSALPATSSSNISSDSENLEMIKAEIETLTSEEDVVSDAREAVAEGVVQSLSQLSITSSCSLGDSFGSQSSWEKLSADLNSSTYRNPQPSSISKAGTCQNSDSPDSDGSFFICETVDFETNDSPSDHMSKNQKIRALSKPQPIKSPKVYQNVETEVQPATNSTLAMQNNPSQAVTELLPVTETSTKSSFGVLEVNQSCCQQTAVQNVPQKKNSMCYSCLDPSTVADAVPMKPFLLSQRDYQALLAGICNDCLLKRLHNDEKKFKLEQYKSAHSALHLKFSKATGLWTGLETCVYIGDSMGEKGAQRTTIWVQFLHQEERLSNYVGKDYLKPKQIQFPLKDVERQMTAQYYVTEFNKSLYDKEVMAQIFFIPSEALLILDGDEIVGCVTVEPYMLGDFVKLTNNTEKKEKMFLATEYGLAFGHFTYLFSGGQEVVVDLQGWVTANGKGLTYLTDPQIHSTRIPKGPSNFAARGLSLFLKYQHGPECNQICHLLKLPPLDPNSNVSPQKL
ncbi:alpha-protein kinase 1 isoform X2 [Oreochromis aureus]|uniref:alpha-protein kinase 1 isoform X2 n=1 Tax=Oreochromis aureus TaxID=47969 RepID=UPI0019542809|nr:alpha-protein kinase 1 isoform X2 [Oreochromis aureus]